MKNYKKVLLISALICFCLILLLGALAYANRGWVRGTFVPNYVDFFYHKGVSKTFDRELGPINEKLNQYGFTVNEQSRKDECWKEASSYQWFYEGFRQTVKCMKYQQSNTLGYSNELSQKWEQTSPQLEQFIIENGWEKQHDQNQKIDEILNPKQSIGVNYTKRKGKIGCRLTIFNFKNPGGVRFSESCTRDVTFFGGR